MIARRFLILASLAALIAAAPASAAGSNNKTRPNVILIVGDDMGYADIGVHGCKDISTPHLDSLAKNGVRCTSGYVSGPYCSPTRAGLLTGRYQTRFGHEFNPGPLGKGQDESSGLSLKETTFPDRMKAAGYATGMVGKWHLGNAPEFQPPRRGFDEFFGFLGGGFTYFPQKGQAGDKIYRGTAPIDGGALTPVEETEYLTDAFAREAVTFVDRHKAEPFFLYLSFNAVHTPLEATDKYLTRFAEPADPKRRAYCAMMSALDDGVGRLLEKLAAEKLEENTLIFFISDNGGPTASNTGANTPLRGFKATTWEGGVRVPFLVQWKGKIPAGKVYEQPVIQIDILPTALAAAGAPIASASENNTSRLDGVDLLPFLTGAADGAPHDALYWRFGPQTAIRRGDWKLVTARDVGPTTKAGHIAIMPTIGPLLFNLRDDIGEQNDLAKKYPEKVAELEAAWNEWNRGNVPASWEQPITTKPPTTPKAKAKK